MIQKKENPNTYRREELHICANGAVAVLPLHLSLPPVFCVDLIIVWREGEREGGGKSNIAPNSRCSAINPPSLALRERETSNRNFIVRRFGATRRRGARAISVPSFFLSPRPDGNNSDFLIAHPISRAHCKRIHQSDEISLLVSRGFATIVSRCWILNARDVSRVGANFSYAVFPGHRAETARVILFREI